MTTKPAFTLTDEHWDPHRGLQSLQQHDPYIPSKEDTPFEEAVTLQPHEAGNDDLRETGNGDLDEAGNNNRPPEGPETAPPAALAKPGPAKPGPESGSLPTRLNPNIHREI